MPMTDEQMIADRWAAFDRQDYDAVFEFDEELRRRKAPGEWMDIGDETLFTPNNDEG